MVFWMPHPALKRWAIFSQLSHDFGSPRIASALPFPHNSRARMENAKTDQCCCQDRRGFLKAVAINVLGAIITLVPFAAGLAVWLDPVRRKTKTGGQLVRVASL